MRRENAKRDGVADECARAGIKDERAEIGEEELLDWHPGFRYIL